MRSLLLALLLLPLAGRAQGEETFVDISTGPDGPPLTSSTRGIQALAVGPDGIVYAGDLFIPSLGDQISGIGRWAGSGWESLGGGVNGTVSALALAPNGHLYVSGSFTEAGGQPFPEVARWTGQRWRRVAGTHPEGPPRSLAVAPGGMLYGTTNSSAPDVAVYRHTGSGWEPVGTDSFAADEIAVGPDGTLYAAGHFTDVGPNDANYLAQWDGADWQPVGGGVDGPVQSLSIAPDGAVAVGGMTISEAGGMSTDRIATWDGTTWTPYLNDRLFTFYSLAFAPSGDLYIGGRFGPSTGPVFTYVARWNGAITELLPERPRLPLDLFAFSPNGDLYIGGGVQATFGSPNLSHVARWSGERWEPLGSSFDSAVLDVTTRDDGSLCAAGAFLRAGGTRARRVACRIGGEWQALGDGLGEGFGTTAYEIESGSGPTLYASTEDFRLVEWTGTRWDTLSTNAAVRAMYVGPDDALYVAGFFLDDGFPQAGIVRRTDDTWETLGGEVPGVEAITVAGDGLLYAGGEFETEDGAPADFVMRWTGSQWEPLPAPISGPVRTFATDREGTLYAVHEGSSSFVSRWTGSQWEALGGAFGGPIQALVADDGGTLYVGGGFFYPSGTPRSY